MSGLTARPLERARQELGAAHALVDAGFPSQALSRAYLSGYHAASAALLASGETPASPAAVVAAFGRRAAWDGGLQLEAGRVLRRLLEDRNDVDYALADAPAERAQAAIADAERVLGAVEAWLGGVAADP